MGSKTSRTRGAGGSASSAGPLVVSPKSAEVLKKVFSGETFASDIVFGIKDGKTATKGMQDAADVFNAVSAFTGGPMDVVRDPLKFDPKVSPYVSFWTGPKGMSKEKYVQANKIMTALATVPKAKSMSPEILAKSHWRGIRLPPEVIETMTKAVGGRDSFHMGKIVSTTVIKAKALDFTLRKMDELKKTDPTRESVLLNFKTGLKRGTHIAMASEYGFERETVTGGKFRILSHSTSAKDYTTEGGIVHIFEVEHL